MALHHQTHPEFVEDCYACKLVGIGFGAAAMPTRKQDVNKIEAKEREWHKDIAAYQSLRRQGLQPRQIDGCDMLSAIARTDNVIEGKPKLVGRESEFLTTGDAGVAAVKQIKAEAAA
jgi:hypothetical protein